MQNMSERPVCHRAEDLVTYLYGEATAAEARDFGAHLEQCDACRAEFSVFNQVHHSIATWRDEALGASTAPTASRAAGPNSISAPFVQRGQKVSAVAALREFFSVSPLWLRGATAFAGLLLCALMVLAASRFWQTPVQVVNHDQGPGYSEEQFRQAVQKGVDERLAQNTSRQGDVIKPPSAGDESPQVTGNRGRARNQRGKGLSREERVQLAADLELISARDEELPFVFPDEPNQ